VENSHLSVRRTLDKIGIPRATFYRWYVFYRFGGPEALEDGRPGPDRAWNRIPEEVQRKLVDLALEDPGLSPRELAVRFTDTEKYFVSEVSAYRLLKAHDLIASPAYIVIKAAGEFKDKTTAPNQLWQTDFTYLKVIGWGWLYLSTVLDDFSRYIIAWKLCTTMRSEDVTATLELALKASGCDSAQVAVEGLSVEQHVARSSIEAFIRSSGRQIARHAHYRILRLSDVQVSAHASKATDATHLLPHKTTHPEMATKFR